ncbi:serine hydrolase domain-containing protein [Streptosporangium carneum]|uniref:Penicillin-binding protein n=1 Tax=Streptosporangium carneum TaxID=47481 RepID=A0A9W6I7R2_9ACTN|nr:serine hydrolase domain-containing protein [Streptosporangium carneum]GLK12758.1 penicillin-binding protein [Streptosporangium carneum]
MPDHATTLREQIAPILERRRVPGAAVGVTHGTDTTLLGFGVTNLEHALPVDGDTIFQVGSISKTLLGLIIGRLAEQGRVSLDAPVAPYFPAGTGVDERITLRHVITHTSGIDAQNMIADAPRILRDHADDSIQASLRHFVRRPLLFAPGTDYSYSGPGIMVAAAVVERVTGRHYADVLQEEVLDPAGMTNTFTTADQVMTRRVAAPHDCDRDGRPVLLTDKGWQRHWQLPGWDVPGGGVLSTVRDLMRYAAYVRSAAAPAGLFDVQARRGPIGRDIGLAWWLEDVAGRPATLHDGLTIGYASRLVLIRSEDVAFVVLTNSLQGGAAVKEIERVIARTLFGEVPRRATGPVDDSLGAALLGTYDCGFYGTVTIAPGARPGELRMVANPVPADSDQFTIELPSADRLVGCGEDSLIMLEPDGEEGSRVPFVREPDGTVSALRIGERIAGRVA